jgi:hypothetical protein
MKQKFSLIIVIFVLLNLLIICGCIEQQTISKTEDDPNKCANESESIEHAFGIDTENITILNSECTTCSPWYTPQLATLNAVVQIDGENYNLYYTNNCPRHQDSIINYRIISNEQTELYNKTKEIICTDFSTWYGYLSECWQTSNNILSLAEFTSCINSYSKYIENDIIDIDSDWEYCSSDGWKNCSDWNSCEITGPTQASICTPEYCKMSCLVVYSEKRIQKAFIDKCKSWDLLGQSYVFSFEVPKDVKHIIDANFLK